MALCAPSRFSLFARKGLSVFRFLPIPPFAFFRLWIFSLIPRVAPCLFAFLSFDALRHEKKVLLRLSIPSVGRFVGRHGRIEKQAKTRRQGEFSQKKIFRFVALEPPASDSVPDACIGVRVAALWRESEKIFFVPCRLVGLCYFMRLAADVRPYGGRKTDCLLSPLLSERGGSWKMSKSF